MKKLPESPQHLSSSLEAVRPPSKLALIIIAVSTLVGSACNEKRAKIPDHVGINTDSPEPIQTEQFVPKPEPVSEFAPDEIAEGSTEPITIELFPVLEGSSGPITNIDFGSSEASPEVLMRAYCDEFADENPIPHLTPYDIVLCMPRYLDPESDQAGITINTPDGRIAVCQFGTAERFVYQDPSIPSTFNMRAIAGIGVRVSSSGISPETLEVISDDLAESFPEVRVLVLEQGHHNLFVGIEELPFCDFTQFTDLSFNSGQVGLDDQLLNCATSSEVVFAGIVPSTVGEITILCRTTDGLSEEQVAGICRSAIPLSYLPQ